ncbi:FAD-binding and (Fe-S)-binding domain-containing protein [Streptacidiphilus jiangxiensis]|uniref:FAD/FMN-containing dehydrogenase n=1 Tax=Streptacidiphilus jiangxiensis TaxID=235985 RepID=A0A1H7X3H3_STRJI|nr:FAD-binding and (Fe-S)-binding domain-containing protein [Streptacidiphilus jiangxiensis]SEM27648.1 FAD/FMN-containing dehydrogenase [Streptacidiphilus jiangxiensis]
MSLEKALRAALQGDVDFGAAQRAVYAYDASNYRQVPLGVVKPASLDDVRAAVALAREHGVSVLARGAGTSIGGQAVSPGALVLDLRAGLGALDADAVDPGARTARVRAGTVLDALQKLAAPHALRFGPDPSTHSRCTFGGMIGNDSCGAHSVAYGRTSDNVRSLDLLLADGTELTVHGPRSAAQRQALLDEPGRVGALHRELHALATENLMTLRQSYPTLPRRGSGYALDALLPERGFDLVRALTGTEGGCAIVLGAVVDLVPRAERTELVVAGYADETAAAEAVVELLPLRPLTAEGMGADLIRSDAERARLPKGGGWLFLEAEAGDHARALERAVRAQGAAVAVVADQAGQRALWRVREAAAGTATRGPDGQEAWPGWEDSAVPPERLAPYLRELRALTADHGLRGTPFGHFGEGCLHLRLDFPLDTPTDGRFRRFLTEAAASAVRHGGSLSGEHGDGQARAELLGLMYPPEVLALFRRFKAAFDPENLLNPGNVVDPRPLDADLRQPGLPRTLPLADGARRCVGVGACVADDPAAVMCPSYAATRDERHSTRGRARLLGELLRGSVTGEGPITDGWRSREVRDALDLCLSCKGCASDCPVHVDMATYKSEFLHRHYRRRLRPRVHYVLGGLPRLLRMLHTVPGAARAARAALRVRPLATLARVVAGTAPERPLPSIPPRSFTSTYHPEPLSACGTGSRTEGGGARRGATGTPPPTGAVGPDAGDAAPRARGGARPGATGALPPTGAVGPDAGDAAPRARGRVGSAIGRGVGFATRRRLPSGGAERAGGDGSAVRSVLLWPDTFGNHLDPDVLDAGAAVLTRLGFRPQLPVGAVCCGLTHVSTGRLDAARRTMARTLRVLAASPADVPVVVLEPSCAAALREELPRLLPEDPRAARLAARVRTFAELLDEADIGEQTHEPLGALAQTHCHQHAVLGTGADERVAARFGLDVRRLPPSCCGLAGNFGFEPGHHDVSVAAAERVLLPALRAEPRARVLADGFSCRTQIAQLADGRRAVHLAQLLRELLEDPSR